MESQSKTLAIIEALGKWVTPREFADYASQDKPEKNNKGNNTSINQSNNKNSPGKN